MKLYALNGSPRKDKNTATLLQSALDGAASTGATTEMIHLYDLTYKPCISCFLCKKLGGKSYGKCAVRDELTPVLEKLAEADGLIFGSPIYFGGISAQLRAFFERFLFQYVVYDVQYSSLAPKKMSTAFLYTMNVTEDMMRTLKYAELLRPMEFFVGNVFSPPQVMYACNTYQFDDYSKYKIECFSEADKAAHRERQFPVDMQAAFVMGEKMVAV